MSVIYYDTAIKQKFKEVFGNTFFATTEEAFKECARINNGKVKLPLISMFRPMGFNINTTRYNEHAFRRGYPAERKEEHPGGKVKMMRELPVRLQYQIDIWAVTKSQCDKLTEELIMWLLYKPYIEFENPDIEIEKKDSDGNPDGVKKIRAALKFEETIQDNSDILSFDDRGRYYRNTFEIYFEEPRIFSYKDFENFADEIGIEYSEIDIENFWDDIEDSDTITDGGEE